MSLVLSQRQRIVAAVSGGASSVPAISCETGIKYSTLYPLLENMTPFEITRQETADGFDRYFPVGQAPSDEEAREPFSICCRLKCHLLPGIGNASVRKWRCRGCGETFYGTRSANWKAKKMRKQKTMTPINEEYYAEADANLAEIRERGSVPGELDEYEQFAAELREKLQEEPKIAARKPQPPRRNFFKTAQKPTQQGTESNGHAEPEAQTVEPRNGAPVTIEGDLRFSLSINIPAEKLAYLGYLEKVQLFEALEKIIKICNQAGL